MPTYDLILLTELRFENAPHRSNEINNVLLEDDILIEALKSKGLKVVRYAWERKDVDWSDTRYILFRTPWNYHNKWNEFFTWFEETKKRTNFINPVSTLRWNLDKRYLFDLEKKGVNVAKTILIEKGSQDSLVCLFEELHCEEAVLKPVISAGGRDTYRINKTNLDNYSNIAEGLLKSESLMLQEFQKSIPSEGELSLMFFGGNYTHAVLKKAKKGEFRVQDDFEGTVHDHIATLEEMKFAKYIISKVDPVPTYGRVDIFRDNYGNLALAELELIEPELWFRNHPPAADVLANEIVKLMQ